jgi:curved DNA-binding protein
MSDYYSILGVDRNASSEDIKRAYRRLASQNHPDKGGDTKRFQEIQAAYDTLSDPDKRSQYDNPQPQGMPGGFHFHTGGGMPPGFEDIFAHAFGGNNPFGDIFGQRRQPGPRNRTLNIQTQISLEEAFHGKELLANLTLPSGRNQTLEIKIPPGIQDGTTLRLSGMGDDSYANIPRGDIHLTVNILEHPVFQRQGDDLVRDIDITCVDAMLGKTVDIDTIDGRTLAVTINPGTQPGQILAAQGHGMPNINDSRFRGRMLMNINISIPTNLTDFQRAALSQVFR